MEGKLSLSFYRGRPKTWSIFPTVSIYQVFADVQTYSVTCLCYWWLGRLVRMSDRLWTACSRAISNFEWRIFKLERTSYVCRSLWIKSMPSDLRWCRWKRHWTSWLLLNGICQNFIFETINPDESRISSSPEINQIKWYFRNVFNKDKMWTLWNEWTSWFSSHHFFFNDSLTKCVSIAKIFCCCQVVICDQQWLVEVFR